MEVVIIFVALATLLQGCLAQIAMDPKVSITETVPSSVGSRVRGFIASDVTLNCYVENMVLGFFVRWQRTTFDETGSEVQTIPVSIDMDSQDVNKWSIEKPTPYSWRLRIKALQLQDEGNYTCFVRLNVETTVEANRTVLATAIPMIIEEQTSSDSTAREGEELELSCNATGRPRPNILWRREGNAILPGGGVIRLSNKLKIEKVDYTHQGRYFCEAINEVGETYRDVILTVQYTPKMIPENKDGYGQAIGYRRTIGCLIDANPQPSTASGTTQLVWVKGNMAMQPDGVRLKTRILEGAYNRLTFELRFFAVEEGDYGTYYCRAKNNMGMNQVEVTLFQTDEPQPDKGYITSAAHSNFFNISFLIFNLLLLIIFH